MKCDKKNNMLGEKLSPIFEEIELAILEFDANAGLQPKYTDKAFRAICKIFMSGMVDKTWDLMEREDIPMNQREEMSKKLGEEIHILIKTYTDFNTFKMYSE